MQRTATLSDHYCGYYIEGDPTSGPATSLSRAFRVLRDDREVFTLEIVIAWSELASRGLNRVEAIEEVRDEGLHRVRGRLSLGWFESGQHYRHIIAGDEEQVDPPLLEAGDLQFASDDVQAEYWLLKALHHIRTRYPEVFRRVDFDWKGVCMVTQIPVKVGRMALDLLHERGLISVQYMPAMEKGQDEPVGPTYILAAGVDYCRRFEQTMLRPKWQIKQAPEEVQMRVPDVIDAIRCWTPKQRFRSEEAYEAALAEYLSGQGIEAPEQQGMSLTDILAAHGIGIEVKLKPDRSEYDRLFGQIIRQLEEFGIVVVLIARPDKRDLLEEYEARFSHDSRVTFIAK
jgi:hypothetical protein